MTQVILHVNFHLLVRLRNVGKVGYYQFQVLVLMIIVKYDDVQIFEE